jgi:precorrin-3B methylase
VILYVYYGQQAALLAAAVSVLVVPAVTAAVATPALLQALLDV